MNVGDLVLYRRGCNEWTGVVLKTSVVDVCIEGKEIVLVYVMMRDGIYTYKNWKLEVLSESR